MLQQKSNMWHWFRDRVAGEGCKYSEETLKENWKNGKRAAKESWNTVTCYVVVRTCGKPLTSFNLQD